MAMGARNEGIKVETLAAGWFNENAQVGLFRFGQLV